MQQFPTLQDSGAPIFSNGTHGLGQSEPAGTMQVLERANENDWGLACGVFAKDINVVNTLTRGLKAGTVWVNTWNM